MPTLVGQIVRFARRPADLLVRVKVLEGVDDADKHCYVVVSDCRRLLVSWSPTLTLTLDVERHYSANPLSLASDERTLQQTPTAKRKFVGEPTGAALVYEIKSLVALESIGVPLSVGDMARALVPSSRRELKRNRAVTAEAARREFTSLGEVDALLDGAATALGTGSDERARLLAIASDALLEPALVAAHFDLLASRSSLLRLPATQLRAFARRALVERTLDERRELARYADMTLDDTDELMPRYPLVGVIDNDLASELEAALGGMRASRSTRFRVDDTTPPKRFFVATNDECYSSARDLALECEAARLLRSAPSVISLTCGVGSLGKALDVLESRVASLLGSSSAAHCHLVLVAPSHRYPAPCISVDEALGGRLSRRHGTPSALVFVAAHRFGLDSFVRVTRTLLGDLSVPLVLLGDPLDSDGSPRAGDRGALMRDVVAASRHADASAHFSVEAALPLEPVGPLGPLDERAHMALRHRSKPTLDLDALTVVRVTERRRGIAAPLLVATGSRREAAEVAVAERLLERASELSTSLTCDAWLALDSGDVVRVVELRRLTRPPPSDGGQLSLASGSLAVERRLSLDDRLGVVVVDESTSTAIDHRLCCRLGSPRALSLARHANEMRRVDVTGARALARLVATRPLFDEAELLLDTASGRSSIEDVRAALSLVRHRLYLRYADDSRLAETLQRHGSRPWTRLVDLLLNVDALLPPPLTLPLVSLARSDAVTAPYTLYFVGSTDARSLEVVASQQNDADDPFPLVEVGSLREHTFARLRADDAVDESASTSLVNRLASRGRTSLCEAVTAYVNRLVAKMPLDDDDELVEHIICVAAKGSIDAATLTRLGAPATLLARLEHVRAPPPLSDDECANDLISFIYAIRTRLLDAN